MDSSDSNRANMPPASSWTLKGDGKLLEYMESIAKNLENRSSKTIRDMNNMMLSVDVAAVNLDNVGNKLQRLQQTQFIENRVQDEDVTMMEGHPRDTKQQCVELLSDVEATKIVMNDSLAMLDKCYEKISLEEDDDDSDNEDDSLRHIYKPIKSYDKRTPYIICTKEWLEKWHIGLKDDSDNEDREPEELINDDESEISERTSREHVSTQEISSAVVKSDFDDESSGSGSPPTVNHIHVPNMSATLSDILNINKVLPELVKEAPPQKVNPEPTFFRNQPTTTTTTTIPQHFNQQFFDSEPPELDNISVGNQSTRAPNLFTESDEENENFITTTPVKPRDSFNSNLFTDTTVKTLDEPDRINVTTPKIPEIDKKIDNLSVDKAKSKLANISKVSNLFESDTDDDEDYFDIIRKSNKKSSTPAKTMSVNLVKEDSPKMVDATVEQKLSLPKNMSPKTPENSKPLQSKPETKHIMKSEPKKVSNLFEDSDDEDDTFVSITPKSAFKPNPIELPKEPPTVNQGQGDSISQTKSNVTSMVKDVNVEKENNNEAQIKHTLKDAEMPKVPSKEVDIQKPVTTPKKLEKILFESSDDEDDFVIPAKVTPEPKLEKPNNLNLVAHQVSQTIEDKPDDIPQDIPSPSEPSFNTASLASEDTSSELFSPHSDVFFTPSDVTPNTTMTTATPVTPIYRSFIDELPPDDDFAGGFDTNDFDADQEDSDNFDQNNISTATDPFLLNEEPPELINEAPGPEPKVVPDKKEKSPVKSSPESFKNKFKMFETIHDTSKLSPEPEKEVKAARKKLNVNLNINVSALLPGAKRPSPKKVDDEPVVPDESPVTPIKAVVPEEGPVTPIKAIVPEKVPEPVASTPQRQEPNEETTESQPNLLVSLNKNRIRAPTTRKPSTRKARVQSYHESTQKPSDIGFDSNTEVKSVVPPLSVAEMLRTAKLKDQTLSRRSLNFDEVDEYDVLPKRKPVKTIQPEKKIEQKVIEKPEFVKKSVETEPKQATKVTTTHDDPFMVASDPLVSEIFKKVQIKDHPKPIQKPVVQEKSEKKPTKVPVFESDSDEDLFSPKTPKEPVPAPAPSQVKPEQKKQAVNTHKTPSLKLPKLFDDSEDDDDLFTSKASKASAKPNKEVKSIVSSTTKPMVNKPQSKNLSKSMFGSDDDDDDLFGGGPVKKRPEKKVSDVQKPVDSLFGDESDDDSLFGGGASKSKGSKSTTIKQESSSKRATQTTSVKKMTSAVNDPLADLLK